MTELDYDTNDPDIKAALLKKIEQETRYQGAQADEKMHQAEVTRHHLNTYIRDEKNLLSTDLFHHVYRYNEEISEYSVQKAMNVLYYWDRNESEVPFEIVFNSPGGEVFAGMELFDFIQELKRKGHHVITSTRGMAASMAGILLQAGHKRVAGREARVLIHEVSSVAFGKIGEIEDQVTLIHGMQDRVLDIFAARAAEAGANGTASDPITKARLRNGWRRKDWWIDSAEMLRLGIVDEVR